MADGDMLFLADFFATAPDWNIFVSKYVTDAGNDLLISLAGHVVFGTPV